MQYRKRNNGRALLYRSVQAKKAQTKTFTDRVSLLTCADPWYRDKPLAIYGARP
jgi:hypothetical protein